MSCRKKTTSRAPGAVALGLERATAKRDVTSVKREHACAHACRPVLTLEVGAVQRKGTLANEREIT